MKKQCKYCETVISAGRLKIEHVRIHLKKCRTYLQTVCASSASADADSKSDTETKLMDCDAHSHTATNEIVEPPTTSASATTDIMLHETPTSKPFEKKKTHLNLKQKSITGHVVKTNAETAKKLDRKIALFFYSCNIPFSVANNPSFIDMIHELRPGYKCPNRKDLGGKLLDDVSESIDLQMIEDLCNSNRPLTILQDGWSNVRNDPIIATSIHTGKDSYLLSATDCGAEKKTAEYCTQLAIQSIEDCKRKYNKDVFALVTDNENKMKMLRRNIRETYSEILTYGCSSHYLNLLENVISPKTVLKHIIEIQTYWRNHHQPHGWLREKNGKMPQIPNDTRWNSQLDCVRTYNQNYFTYREIIKEHPQEIIEPIKRKINDFNIYQNSLDLEEQLKVVGTALDTLQGDNVSLADAVHCWIKLLESDSMQHYKDDVLSKFREAMQPFHYVAYLTDPKYLDKPLPEQYETEAEEWLAEQHPNFLNGLLLFKIKDADFYPKAMFTDSVVKGMPAHKWWTVMSVKFKDEERKKMAVYFSQLHSCPASSAAIERIFSTFGLVWSKLRNKLGASKVEKLVKIYRYCQIKKNK
ncbi:uncharacterized protein LOC116159856 [Photinus pyralis]|uniref:uncharacterized protein LOC116159856 n=1 Tax=Photinus pyralis TaxID=7054 RepID=UPI0012672033|nr:uncharacterized protein LOC116159856 [Photinus pyralis]